MFTSKSCPQLPHPHVFLTLLGMVIPPVPSGITCSSAWASFQWTNFFLLSNLNFTGTLWGNFVSSCHLLCGRTDCPHLATASFQVVVESNELPPRASFSPGWISQRSLSAISCVVHISYIQIKAAQIFSITLFILLWNKRNPCLWEKSIKTTINLILSDICSCAFTFIWIVVYFGHILLFSCSFGHKLCVKWVHLCKSDFHHLTKWDIKFCDVSVWPNVKQIHPLKCRGNFCSSYTTSVVNTDFFKMCSEFLLGIFCVNKHTFMHIGI